jgi:hypothetical protein
MPDAALLVESNAVRQQLALSAFAVRCMVVLQSGTVWHPLKDHRHGERCFWHGLHDHVLGFGLLLAQWCVGVRVC